MANWQKRNKFLKEQKEREEGKKRNPFRSVLSLAEQLAWSEQRTAADDKLDIEFGYPLLTPGPPRLGFLLKMAPTTSIDVETRIPRAALGLYLLQADGTCFKCVKPYEPYFYLLAKDKYMTDVEEYLRRTFPKEIVGVSIVDKEDLELTNHLSGLKRQYIKVSFLTVQALLNVRGKLMGRIKKNRRRLGIDETYELMHEGEAFEGESSGKDYADYIYDIREYDVTYYQRVAIDMGFRVGYWYGVRFEQGNVIMECRRDLLDRPRLKIMAFDIETTHAPMRFPDAETDCITMISFMLDQQGYLIVNREIVSQDVHDFEYTPKPEFYGPFRVFNEPNESAVLRRFLDIARHERPHVFVSFNGDTFDWPFIDARAKIHGMSLQDEIGMHGDKNEEYTCHYASHLDCFKWVVRDSYLPAGSQGLKAVTKGKLGYDPLELDPEEMVRFATEHPQTLASYSVSDAVATYYLYQNYVHPFIFSLCTIIPMHPDDVLRKGSGTLCEALLMVQATLANVIYPNKSAQEAHKMHKGHLIESETYIGGHVESLAAGVFRSDIPMHFELDIPTLETLLAQLDSTLKFAVETDGKGKLEQVGNYDEVRNQVANALQQLRDAPTREEKPLIYHLDVGAMYPNIILTNRLQPSAIVDEMTCAGCDFNKPENKCQRNLGWTWRGELLPTTLAEYEQLRSQIETERFPNPNKPDTTVTFFQLPLATQQAKLKQRLKDYARRVYKKNHVTIEEDRVDTVCMRENSFYIDTVRLFRDRRYEYKNDWTSWKNKLAKAQADKDAQAIIKAKEMVVIYESLQIAHKCILNSFYGYVMRRGARWFSMEMAGMVTKTGAQIIQRTRELVERVGIPLELDTDGIWCVLPATFPENFKITWKDPQRKPFVFSYMCMVLNHMVNREFTNDQYQTLKDPQKKIYEVRSENSIFFEVDGPYRAMMLPASSEEGKTLKKRYAVFRMDGTLAELKGFELKRRGELNLIKIFQGKIFETFLRGSTLEQTYQEVGKVANQWLDILYNKGEGMEDEELIDLLSSSSSMSKALAEYGESKSNAITTAKRLGEFLGPQMVSNKGLACKYLISKEPTSAPVTDRAIPVIIFSADRNTRNYFLRKWTRDTSKSTGDYGIRDILDWEYYISRFGKTLQKLCTIPAAMQGVANPIPRVLDPDWLRLKKRGDMDPRKQKKIDAIFVAQPRQKHVQDIESLAQNLRTPMRLRQEGGTLGRQEEGGGSPRATARRRLDISSAPTAEGQDTGAVVVAVEDTVSRQENYAEWLRGMKRKWQEQRLGRKKHAAAVSAASSTVSTGGKVEQPKFVIRSYEDRGRFRYALSTWQVLQLQETDRPGEFVVWAIVGAEGMRKLTLLASRRILVNTAVADADVSGGFAFPAKRVSYALPHSKPAQNLYEVELAEPWFQRSFRQLSSNLCSSDVEGVYETKSSLILSALRELGVCADVDVVALAQDRDKLPLDAFRLSHMRRHSPSQRDASYVSADNLKLVFLYHSCSRDQTRGVFGLFLPESSSHVHVVVYSPQRVDSGRIEEFLASKNNSFAYDVKKFSRRDLACKQVEKVLQGFHALAYGVPSVIALQTTVADSQILVEIPSLNEFPVVRLIANEQDNQYESRATSWELFAMGCLLQRQAHVREWLEKQLAFAQYAEIPFANFSFEFPSFVSDVLFERALKRNGLVSWASENNRPDLGGAEEDHNIMLVDLENPEIVYPGCYDTVCIELNLFNLALNAILQSHLINVAEGGPALAQAAPQQHQAPQGQDQEQRVADMGSIDDTADCVPAFMVLRGLIHQWVTDVGSRENYNEWPEVLLHNVYHWISSPQSRMYDPAIHRLIHMLMRKVFLQLLHELKSLGSKIVYATFNQIIISTNKTNVQDAKVYWEFVHKTIFSKDLFLWLTIEPSTFWNVLLFSDVSNYGGVPARDDGQEGQIVSNWNLAEYLPPPVDQSFILTVSQYIMNLYLQSQRASEAAEDHGEPQAMDIGDDDAAAAAAGAPSAASERQGSKRRRGGPLIDSELTQRLFQAVTALKNDPLLKKGVGANAKKLPGYSSTQAASPTLQYVTTVCHVLELDKENAVGVNNLRRDLLKLVGVDEFSREAEFKDLAPSFVLQDVICDFCTHPHNMDLLRDPNLLAHNWECTHCGHVYNQLVIESMLVQQLYQMSFAYQSQDLVCSKCKLVKAENLSTICPSCSGTYVCRVSATEMSKKLDIFSMIADFHKMPWLDSVVVALKAAK